MPNTNLNKIQNSAPEERMFENRIRACKPPIPIVPDSKLRGEKFVFYRGEEEPPVKLPIEPESEDK